MFYLVFIITDFSSVCVYKYLEFIQNLKIHHKDKTITDQYKTCFKLNLNSIVKTIKSYATPLHTLSVLSTTGSLPSG